MITPSAAGVQVSKRCYDWFTHSPVHTFSVHVTYGRLIRPCTSPESQSESDQIQSFNVAVVSPYCQTNLHPGTKEWPPDQPDLSEERPDSQLCPSPNFFSDFFHNIPNKKPVFRPIVLLVLLVRTGEAEKEESSGNSVPNFLPDNAASSTRSSVPHPPHLPWCLSTLGGSAEVQASPTPPCLLLHLLLHLLFHLLPQHDKSQCDSLFLKWLHGMSKKRLSIWVCSAPN